jgi:hypothetical protein
VTLYRAIPAVAIAVVLLAVVAAFIMLGSPTHQRALALDRQRVRDLRDTAQELHEQYATEPLPAKLAQPKRDPISGAPYEYRRLSGRDYMLCAQFELPEARTDREPYVSESWRHAAGRFCYRLDAHREVP